MTAGAALQAAIVGLFTGMEGLAGIYDGPPARAEYPYLVVDCGTETDWSCASHRGREVTLQLIVWDDQPARLAELEERFETSLSPKIDVTGWGMVTLHLREKKRLRQPGAPGNCSFRFRTRLLQSGGGAT